MRFAGLERLLLLADVRPCREIDAPVRDICRAVVENVEKKWIVPRRFQDPFKVADYILPTSSAPALAGAQDPKDLAYRAARYKNKGRM